jgi:ATP-dependent Clp protease ATP-binding subunit ClpA
MSSNRITTNPERSRTRDRISDQGRKAAAARHARSKEAVLAAMKHIEETVMENDGIYPERRDGKVTKQLLLDKAGLSSSYLEKQTLKMKAFKREVNAWIKKMEQVSPGNVDAIRRRITHKAQTAREEARTLRQAYVEAELLHAQTISDLDQARRTIEELKEQNTALLKQLACKKVIPIGRGRTK